MHSLQVIDHEEVGSLEMDDALIRRMVAMDPSQLLCPAVSQLQEMDLAHELCQHAVGVDECPVVRHHSAPLVA